MKGSLTCHNEVKTVVVDHPVEQCDEEPVRNCRHVTKLVPQLKAHKECTQVPKEVCARSKTNPRTVKRPIIKKW